MTPGTKLGPYEVVALIGAGGMGEVYRARDTKLKRDVALKVLPEAVADDPERMARFQREAEVLASLNHPNIAQIYGVEERALVMELVEGESPKGPMAFEEAWKIASQITAALEYAHDKGIVHRDLKPANIKITPEGVVKLLDFGLAKAFTGQTTTSSNLENSPTLTLGATQLGVILGTAAYMAPEQAKGKTVDKRADIWSFGVVLHELLTGERLFTGEDVSDTLADVLKKEPNLDKVPIRVRRLLRECLAKDPKKRLRDIGDVERVLVEDTSTTPTARSPVSRSRLGNVPWIATGVMTAVAAALAFVYVREKPPATEVVRFQVPPPGQSDFASASVILSPDGRRLAFLAPGPGNTNQLWVRSFDSLESKPLSGTENANAGFFWSPDSRYLAFEVQGRVLKKVEVSGGPPQSICDLVGSSYYGGAWSPEGVIVFGTSRGGLMRVSEAGGTAAPLTTLDRARGDVAHTLPAFLPDGKHFLYVAQSSGQSGIYVGALDFPPGQQSKKRLLFVDGAPSYAPAVNPNDSSAPGYLLFTREGSLLAQPFDAGKLVLAGNAVPIAEGLPRGNPPQFSVSRTGVLAYRTGSGTLGALNLTWFDREGKTLGTAGEPGDYNTVSLSPDGSRVAASRIDGGNSDIWLHEFARGISTRLTFDPAQDWLAVWSPNGDRIIFSSGREGGYNLYQKAASGAGPEEVFYKSSELKFAQDWSRDGRFLLYSTAGAGLHLWYLPVEGERKPVPYLKTEFNESQGRFSPDSRFVAYSSNASGRQEIYVQPFPAAAAGKWQVSKGGGVEPRWRADGKELYYISPNSEMMAVAVSTNPTFAAAPPKALFRVPISGGGTPNNVTRYDVTADGKKFLVNALPSQGEGKTPTPITVVLNWEAGLKK